MWLTNWKNLQVWNSRLKLNSNDIAPIGEKILNNEIILDVQLAKFKEGWNAFKVYLESLNSDSIKPTKIELSHFNANEIKPMHLLFVDSIKEMGQSSGIIL